MSQFETNHIDLFEQLLEKIPNAEQRNFIKSKIAQINATKLNILVVGATGVGKSSTINAIFAMDIAKVGQSSEPETKEITPFELKNTIIWDTPGLGDSTENDKCFAEMIEKKLLEKDPNGEGLIDLVLCILDGASRDLGTTYTLLVNHIIPHLNNEPDRLIIAINKADLAMSGRNWDYENNCPAEKLKNFLDEKIKSTQGRLFKDTGFKTEPIYYVAGYKEDDQEQKPYNVSKLLNTIVTRVKEKKRAVILKDVNKNSKNFKHDDGQRKYNEDTQEKVTKSFFDTLKEIAGDVFDAVTEFLTSEKGKEILKTVGVAAAKAIWKIFKK